MNFCPLHGEPYDPDELIPITFDVASTHTIYTFKCGCKYEQTTFKDDETKSIIVDITEGG